MLSGLAADGAVDPSVLPDAIKRYDIDTDVEVPWHG